jgi:hypothetical protein
MESWVFIGILAALYAVFWFMDREGKSEVIRPGGRPMEEGPYRFMCAIAGALLFAGTLADHGHKAWPGLIAGAVAGFIGYLALGRLFMRANQRLFAAGDNGTILGLGRDLLVIALAAVSVLLDPAGYAILLVAIVLILMARGRQDEKYEGLRILR